VDENLNLESKGVRVPHQVTAFADHARSLLKPAAEPPPTAENKPPAPPFTFEELLKAPTPDKDSSRDYWHARANVVEGFRREDNARSQSKIQTLEAEIAALKTKNLELVQARTAPPPTAGPPAASPSPAPPTKIDLQAEMRLRFSQEEIESLGEERMLMLTREFVRAGETVGAAQKALETMRATVNELVEARNSTVKQDQQHLEDEVVRKHRLFLEKLSEGFPTWKQTNVDPRWIKWLGELDPGSGLLRQDILDRHQHAKDAPQVVRMLEAFVKSLAPAPTPPPGETPGQLEATGADAAYESADLAGVMPLTEAEIRDGYKRKALGKFSAEDAAAFDKRVAATMKARGKH
jgi:hypothetical protein